MNSTVTKSERIQSSIECILSAGAFILAVGYVLFATFRYTIPFWPTGFYLWYYALGLAAIIVLYFVGFFCLSKVMRRRVKKALQTASFEQIFVIGFFLWFMLDCCVIQKRLGRPYVDPTSWLVFDSGVCALVLFQMAKFWEIKKAKRMIELLMHVVAITYSVFTVFCLWNVFHLHFFDLPSGELVGMTRTYRLMLGYHSNTTGMIAATVFCLCIYMVFTQALPIKIIYTVFGLAQLLAVYLSNCRVAFVAILAFLTLVVFFWSWDCLQNGLIIKIGIALMLSIGCFLIVWVGRKGTFLLFERITHFRSVLNASAEKMTGTGYSIHAVPLISGRNYQSQVMLLASEEENEARELTDLSSRLSIWITGIRIMTSSWYTFLFGMSPFVVPKVLTDIGEFQRQIAHMHNTILQVGICLGVPAMAAYVTFLFRLFIRCLDVMFGKWNQRKRFRYLIPGIILCFLIIGMAEAYLFAYFSAICCFFYLLCGWIVAVFDEGREISNA